MPASCCDIRERAREGTGEVPVTPSPRSRLLFLAHRVPYPPNKGDKIRAFHELRGLASRGHEVHLFAFADDPADCQHASALARWCATVRIVPLSTSWAKVKSLAGVLGRDPLSIRYFHNRGMASAVSRAIASLQPDGIVVYCSSMAQYVPPAWRERTVVDLVDVDSEKWREYAAASRGLARMLYRLEWRRLRTFEETVVSDFAASIVTTEREADLLRQAGRGAARLHAIGNGVDTDHFRNGCDASLTHAADAHRAAARIVFTGAMDYAPNVDAVRHFADTAFPLVRQRHPNAEFVIVGSKPARDVRRLAGRDGIVVTGAVADVRPYLASAAVCVVPLRIARGIQNKLLEAMSFGCAVVATPAAASALGPLSDEELLVREAPADFADAVSTLIENPVVRTNLGRRARLFVEQRCQWDRSLDRLTALIESTIH